MSRPVVVGVLVALLAGCGSSEEGRPPRANAPTTPASGAATATATDLPTVTSTANAPGAPASPSVARTPATSTAPSAAAPPAVAVRPRIAVVGSYPVDQSGSETFGPQGGQQQTRSYPATSTFEVRAGATANQRTFVVRYSPDRQDDLQLDLARNRALLLRGVATFRVGGFTQTRTFAPDPPVLAYPGAQANGHAFSGSFSGTTTGRYRGQVLRRERLVIGGVAVQTVVVRLVTEFTGGETTGTITTVTHWDPQRMLPLRQQVDASLRDSLNTYSQHAIGQLTSLQPR